MKTKHTLLVCSILACNPGLAMEPMDIEGAHSFQSDSVPSLRTLCCNKITPHLPEFLKNSESFARLICLPTEVKQELWLNKMLEQNYDQMQRNASILWLLAQCPIVGSLEEYKESEVELLYPLHRFGDLCLQMVCATSIEVKKNDTQELVFRIEGESPIACAQFSTNGKYVYILFANRSLKVFSTTTWQEVHSVMKQGRLSDPRFLFLTRDSRAVICGSINTLIAYDSLTGEPICDLVRGSHARIDQVKLSADGNKVYVFYQSVDEIFGENVHNFSNMENGPVLADVFDISQVQTILSQLAELSLEQLLVVELAHKISLEKEGYELMRLPHIQRVFKDLPENIRLHLNKAVKINGPGLEAPLKRWKNSPNNEQ